jgi:predicted GNAT family acetyltransferase
LVEDGHVVGVADYEERGDMVVLPRTLIELSRQGHGLGAELVAAVLDDLQASGRKVVPVCWYVREFMDEHAQYQEMLADGG